MNISFLRWLALPFAVWTLTVLLSGCFTTGGGYYGEDFGPAYYEPAGVVYGGWGPGYHVAPFRDAEHRDHREDRDHPPTREGGHAPARAYSPAPASHSMPSIPSQSRSGGSRSRH